MKAVDILLLIVSCLLIAIIVLQKSKEDASQAFTGEKSDLFANKKERGIEVWITRLTAILSVAFSSHLGTLMKRMLDFCFVPQASEIHFILFSILFVSVHQIW